MLAVYVENCGSVSDYHSLYDSFNSVDEIYSNMINFIRKSKLRTYIPESLTKKDRFGNIIPVHEADMDNVIVFDGDRIDAGQVKEVNRDQVEIMNTIIGYKDMLTEAISNTLREVGLSLTSIGYNESSSDASGEAITSKESLTNRTRKERNKLWAEAFDELNVLLLELYLGTDLSEYSFSVIFSEYVKSTTLEKTELLIEQLNNGLISKRLALQELYPDLDETAIEELLAEIEKENYIPEVEEDEADIVDDVSDANNLPDDN